MGQSKRNKNNKNKNILLGNVKFFFLALLTTEVNTDQIQKSKKNISPRETTINAHIKHTWRK